MPVPFSKISGEAQPAPLALFPGSPDPCLHIHMRMEPFSSKAAEHPNLLQNSQNNKKFPKDWDAAEQHQVYLVFSMVSMKCIVTFPISSFRWSGNYCTGWNNCWNHCCSCNPCRNHNCSCKEDVRQVLVSKLLIRLFSSSIFL